MLELIHFRLEQVGLRCVKLDGGMTLEQRNRTIDTFTHNPGAHRVTRRARARARVCVCLCVCVCARHECSRSMHTACMRDACTHPHTRTHTIIARTHTGAPSHVTQSHTQTWWCF
jgi:hypothetical protein